MLALFLGGSRQGGLLEEEEEDKGTKRVQGTATELTAQNHPSPESLVPACKCEKLEYPPSQKQICLVDPLGMRKQDTLAVVAVEC